VGGADELHVTTWGDADGEPVLFVHGSMAAGPETWQDQQPLADGRRLLLVDRRGYGDSPAGDGDFERDAADVAELLDGGAHLVGNSYGGLVALLAAARRPDAVRSLAVIEPPALALVRGRDEVESFFAAVAGAYTLKRRSRYKETSSAVTSPNRLPPSSLIRNPANIRTSVL
jgi:pimeloyl-ACP methyl ester carboxylesterase